MYIIILSNLYFFYNKKWLCLIFIYLFSSCHDFTFSVIYDIKSWMVLHIFNGINGKISFYFIIDNRNFIW